jgi:hypothetical protein
LSASKSPSLSPSLSASLSPSPSGEAGYYSINRNFFLDIGNKLSTQIARLRMPTWGSDERPANPHEGEFGFNLSDNTLEIYDGTAWFAVSLSAI